MDAMMQEKSGKLQDSGSMPVSRRSVLKAGPAMAAGIAFLGIGLFRRSAQAQTCGPCNPCGTPCSAGCSDGGCDSSPCMKPCSPGVGVA
jgi:hypothetical protein